MALAQKSNSNRTGILMIILAVAVVGGIIVYAFFRPDVGGIDLSGGPVSTDPEVFTDFGEDLYETEQFKALHDFSRDVPVDDLAPVPVPDAGIEDQVDLPPNTEIGNIKPFR